MSMLLYREVQISTSKTSTLLDMALSRYDESRLIHSTKRKHVHMPAIWQLARSFSRSLLLAETRNANVEYYVPSIDL